MPRLVLAPLALLGALTLLACAQPETQGGEPADAPAGPAAPTPPAAAAPMPEPAPAPAAPAAPAAPEVLNGVALTGGVSAVGTEPFWDVQIAGERLTLSGVDRPERSTRHGGVTVRGDRAAWWGRFPDGQAITVAVTPGPCSDGMSDRTYPLKASVSLGSETLTGCAASTVAIRRGGESGEVR
ncbi:MAG TPA: hypothetical protein VGB49_04395 [Caulobacteraceae bacterium]|jgi:uncharacterized membrane protein